MRRARALLRPWLIALAVLGASGCGPSVGEAPAGDAPPAPLAPRTLPAPLPDIFGDHMVLQGGQLVPLSGSAQPGDAIVVRLDGRQVASATALADGSWQASLPAQPAGGPHEIEIVATPADSSTPPAARRYQDVLFGEVWVCAGGGNMAWPVRLSAGGPELRAEQPPDALRVLVVRERPAIAASAQTEGAWQTSDPKSIADVSAIAWYFGRALQRSLGVPVGVLIATSPTARIEPWIPRSGYLAVQQTRHILGEIEQNVRAYRAGLGTELDQLDAWLDEVEVALRDEAPLPPAPALPRHPLTDAAAPTSLALGMIAPLARVPVAGVVWYQGEYNVGDGPGYTGKLEALVRGWRAEWRLPGLPFVLMQLPPYRYGQHRDTEPPASQPDVERLPRFWQAQQAVLELPGTSLTVCSDLVDPDDFFPLDKREFGERLALSALADVYGLSVEASGPVLAGVEPDERRLVLRFDHAEGLTTRDGKPPDLFEVANDDRTWTAAHASIEGDTVIVEADGVDAPVGVRMGWHQEAQPNLANGAGLPAWPLVWTKPAP